MLLRHYSQDFCSIVMLTNVRFLLFSVLSGSLPLVVEVSIVLEVVGFSDKLGGSL